MARETPSDKGNRGGGGGDTKRRVPQMRGIFMVKQFNVSTVGGLFSGGPRATINTQLRAKHSSAVARYVTHAGKTVTGCLFDTAICYNNNIANACVHNVHS